METKIKFTVMLVHPETLQVLTCFQVKGIPMVFDSEAEAAAYMKEVKTPGHYRIDKYYILQDDGDKS